MSKLEYDGHLVGNDRARLAYLFMRMEPDAQLKVRAYYNAVHIQEAYTLNLFIEYLDSVYIDPNETGRALDRLHHMKQGEREPFASFFPKFERTLAEAQMSFESDRTRISFLEGTLNRDIRRAMIGKIRSTYVQFAAELQLVGSQLDRLYQTGKRVDNERSIPKDRPRKQEQGNKQPAKWVSPEELIWRKETNVCLRCGKDGHRIRDCSFWPAQRPVNSWRVPGLDLG